MWQVFAQAGMKAAGAYLGASLNNAVGAANARVSNAKARADYRMRQASNGFEAAKLSLAKQTQSVNNNRVLEAMGQNLEATLVTARRQDDALVRTSFEDTIRQSETLGGQAGAAAAAGQIGGGVDMVNAATRLQFARASRDVSRARTTYAYDVATRMARTAEASIRGMDDSMLFGNFDFSQQAEQQYKGQSPWLAAIMAGGESLAGNAGSLLSTGSAPTTRFSFGAPALGNNVAAQPTTYSFGKPKFGGGI